MLRRWLIKNPRHQILQKNVGSNKSFDFNLILTQHILNLGIYLQELHIAMLHCRFCHNMLYLQDLLTTHSRCSSISKFSNNSCWTLLGYGSQAKRTKLCLLLAYTNPTCVSIVPNPHSIWFWLLFMWWKGFDSNTVAVSPNLRIKQKYICCEKFVPKKGRFKF